MEHQDLIIQLIQQDLKHCKLTKSFLELCLEDGGLYDLDILTIVSHLMGVENDEISDKFTDIYCGFMHEIHEVKTLELDNKIPLIANQCYGMLKSLVEIEERLNPEN